MVSKSNQAKSEFLGMPAGTAWARLRKQIIFKLVKETGRDKCFRCGKIIGEDSDLTVEHKKPWQNVSVDLFWDLDNIAFSHKGCNRPHGSSLTKVGPEGTSWCHVCLRFLPVVDFHKRRRRKLNGLDNICKKCNHRRGKEWRQSS